MVWVLQVLPNQPVVVDLAIDSEGNALVGVGQWLRSALHAYNTQTLVGKNLGDASEQRRRGFRLRLTCVVGRIGARPIWTTMPALLGHLQSRRLEGFGIWHMVTAHDAAHTGLYVGLVGGGGGRGREEVRLLRANWSCLIIQESESMGFPGGAVGKR